MKKHHSKPAITILISVIFLATLGSAFIQKAYQDTTGEKPGYYITVRDNQHWVELVLSTGMTPESLWQTNGIVNPARIEKGQRIYIVGGRYSPRLVLDSYPTTLTAALASGLSPIAITVFNQNAFAYPELINVYIPLYRSRAHLSSEPTPIVIPPTPTVDSQTAEPGDPPNALDSSLMGIQGHFFVEAAERRQLLDMVAYDLRLQWVKQQIRWAEFEYAPGQYSNVMLDALDQFMDDAQNRGLNVLLSIAHAPDWARVTPEEDGPPVDFAYYNAFVKFIVLRYKDKIGAIEVWNEPNFRREWNGGTLDGAEYVQLLAGAYHTIKIEYPEGNIPVISAGLVPTGVNDGVNVVDDRVYLRQMYAAGLSQYADAIGVHPYSWANPPWAVCCEAAPGILSHYEHPSFYFANTIADYRDIQAAYGDSSRPLWITEFGWGTMEGLNKATPYDSGYFSYINLEQQATYILEAFRIAQSWDFAGPMILWNLNFAALQYSNNDHAGYSILVSLTEPRPAYERLRDAPRR